MVKTKTKSFELVNEELKLFISYFGIRIQSQQQYINVNKRTINIIQGAMYYLIKSATNTIL